MEDLGNKGLDIKKKIESKKKIRHVQIQLLLIFFKFILRWITAMVLQY